MESHSPEPDNFRMFGIGGTVDVTQMGSIQALSNLGYLLSAILDFHIRLQSKACSGMTEYKC